MHYCLGLNKNVSNAYVSDSKTVRKGLCNSNSYSKRFKLKK